MASFANLLPYPLTVFFPGSPTAKNRKYGMGLMVRGRAQESVSNAWFLACKDVDVMRRYRGAQGPVKEPIRMRYYRFRKRLPIEAARWRVCRELNLPRSLTRRRPINHRLHKQKLGGNEPAVVRAKCKAFGPQAWQTTKHVYMDQPWSLADTHRRFVIYPPWCDEIAPSHMIRFIERAQGDLRPVTDDEVGVQFPIHGTIAQAFLAHFPRLPRSHGLTRMMEFDDNGIAIDNSETSEGDVPFVTVVVPNTEMIPQLLYYIYHQDQEALLKQLVGDYAQPIVNEIELTHQSAEFTDVRTMELSVSEKIAEHVKEEHVNKALQEVYKLWELADFLGMADDRFWSVMHTSYRVLLDAAGLKKTWAMRWEDQALREKFEREARERELREEREAEEKQVEELLFEDDVEEMEVEEMLFEDEDEIVEIPPPHLRTQA